MTPRTRFVLPLLLALVVLLPACRSSTFEPPQVQGPVALVDDGGQPRAWVLTKQEESRQVGIGGGSRHDTGSWRTDTFFHFRVEAFDPATARPLWHRRLLTLGDFEAENAPTSRVIGSSVDARLLGQDGKLVWLLIGAQPFAIDAHDGRAVLDADALQQRNPQLRGLLPTDAKNYGFDQGLVVLAADARRFVVRGAQAKAIAYEPPPPAAAPEGPLRASGRRQVVPMRPPFGAPVRTAQLGGAWLGLYTDKEANDAGSDDSGEHLLWPYTVLDEGSLARRGLWRATIATAQRFDDRYERLSDLTPVAAGPTFLRGRFLEAGGADEALQLAQPDSVLVMHVTRIDDAGHRTLTRLGADLAPLWTTELPLSDYGNVVDPLRYWQVGEHLVLVGELRTRIDGVTHDAPHLASVRLADGALQAWNLEREAPADPGAVEVE
jgi:hypothetical protein